VNPWSALLNGGMLAQGRGGSNGRGLIVGQFEISAYWDSIWPMKPSLAALCMVFLTGCQQVQNGYKIVSYSPPPSKTQPEFIIFHKNVQITAKCDNYYGSHVRLRPTKRFGGNNSIRNQNETCALR